MASENVLTITDQNFEAEVLKSGKPFMLDFWATWCQPCLRLGPIVDEVAAENAATFRVGKLDVDNNPETAQEFGVSSIPTLVFFKGGQEVDRIVGGVPKSVLQQKIKQYS